MVITGGLRVACHMDVDRPDACANRGTAASFLVAKNVVQPVKTDVPENKETAESWNRK